MKCAVLYAPGDLRIEEKPIPAPKPHNVLIKVALCGLCGTDILLYEGKIPTSFPYSPGHELSGRIVRVGKGVENLKVGDPVVVDPNYSCELCYYCTRGLPHLCQNRRTGVKSNGGFAEYCMVPGKMVYKIPITLAFKEAVLAEPLSCALHVLDQAEVQKGDTVVILGGGTLGLMLTKLIRDSGRARMIVVSEPISPKRQLAQQLGADVGVNPEKEDLRYLLGKDIPGADVVIDAVGLPQTFQQAFQVARNGGRLILAGLYGPAAKSDFLLSEIVSRELTLKGAFLNPLTFPRALELLATGKIDAALFITHQFPLNEIKKALAIHRKGEAVKVVIGPNEEV